MKSKGIVCYKGGNCKVSCLRQKVPLGIEPRISCLWVRFFDSLSHRDAWLLFSFNWFASKLEILRYVILKAEVLRCICGLCVSWAQCRDWALGPTHLDLYPYCTISSPWPQANQTSLCSMVLICKMEKTISALRQAFKW